MQKDARRKQGDQDRTQQQELQTVQGLRTQNTIARTQYPRIEEESQLSQC